MLQYVPRGEFFLQHGTRVFLIYILYVLVYVTRVSLISTLYVLVYVTRVSLIYTLYVLVLLLFFTVFAIVFVQ